MSGNGIEAQYATLRKDSANPAVFEAARRSLASHWYAVHTSPRHEKAASSHLEFREIEVFLPTFQQVRVWKNRQRATVISPLFPGYLFVRIEDRQRASVLSSPGVLRIVGNAKGPLPIPNSAIEFLSSDLCRNKLEPYPEMAVGQRVRIKDGAMREVAGVLVRKGNALRFVIQIELINQSASLEVDASNLEPILA